MKSLTAVIIVTLTSITFSVAASNMGNKIEDAGEKVQTSRQQQMEQLQRLGL